MDILIHYIIPFVGMLVALIVIHELGHYITAKLFGITVLEAGIGYPPRAWGFTWRGTIYSINWLPLGGFVRLLGEEDPSDPHSLAAQKAWKRIIVLASGAGMNFVLPIVLFALVFMIPRNVPKGPVVIDVVEQNSPAAQAGLQQGDTILKINGHDVANTEEAGTLHPPEHGQDADVRGDPHGLWGWLAGGGRERGGALGAAERTGADGHPDPRPGDGIQDMPGHLAAGRVLQPRALRPVHRDRQGVDVDRGNRCSLPATR